MMDYIVHNLFSTEAGVIWLVLKWILVVAAAGFIGQFGKSFAKHLMQKAQERRKPDAVPVLKPQSPPPAVKKEAGLPAVPQAAGPITERAEATRFAGEEEARRKALAKEEKKAGKERQKLRKKGIKNLKKLFK
jgi:hypothetical protein